MNPMETIIALIFAPTSIVAAVTWLLTKYFEKTLSRDIEGYKAKLQHEFEQSKIRLENELQAKLFEHQTKFSLFHNKRAVVISELYSLLHDATLSVSILVNPAQYDDGKTNLERNTETANVYN